MEKYKRPPDIIVNSAGIIKPCYFLRLKEEDFDKIIDVNLKGTFLVTQVFNKIKDMYRVSQKGGLRKLSLKSKIFFFFSLI